jgi:prepilin peptidase CpaA
MSDNSYLLFTLIAVTCATLIYMAFVDLRDFRIPNPLVIAVGLLFFLYFGISGRWVVLLEHVGLATFVFAFLLVFYRWNWAGGGDVKMLTVAYLWTGIQFGLIFSLLLCAFALLHVLAGWFGFVKLAPSDGGRPRIPFAPSIAASLVIVLILSIVAQ